MADDFGTMRTRILDELNRTDLTSQAGLAINSAIKFYEKERFWFNEGRAVSDTVADQEYYSLPSDYIDTDILSITVNNYSYVLPLRPNSYIEETYVNNSSYSGYPKDHSIHEEQLRLYPIPNGAYEMKLTYIRKLNALSNATDTNAWMTDAEELIRSRAEADMYRRLLKDPNRAAEMSAVEFENYKKMKASTNKRLMVGRTKAHW